MANKLSLILFAASVSLLLLHCMVFADDKPTANTQETRLQQEDEVAQYGGGYGNRGGYYGGGRGGYGGYGGGGRGGYGGNGGYGGGGRGGYGGNGGYGGGGRGGYGGGNHGGGYGCRYSCCNSYYGGCRRCCSLEEFVEQEKALYAQSYPTTNPNPNP